MENINNLDNFNVKKLNSNKAAKINGGAFPWKPIATYLAEKIADNWDDVKEGFEEEWNSGG